MFKWQHLPCDRSRDGTWSSIDNPSIRQFSGEEGSAVWYFIERAAKKCKTKKWHQPFQLHRLTRSMSLQCLGTSFPSPVWVSTRNCSTCNVILLSMNIDFAAVFMFCSTPVCFLFSCVSFKFLGTVYLPSNCYVVSHVRPNFPWLN